MGTGFKIKSIGPIWGQTLGLGAPVGPILLFEIVLTSTNGMTCRRASPFHTRNVGRFDPSQDQRSFAVDVFSESKSLANVGKRIRRCPKTRSARPFCSIKE